MKIMYLLLTITLFCLTACGGGQTADHDCCGECSHSDSDSNTSSEAKPNKNTNSTEQKKEKRQPVEF